MNSEIQNFDDPAIDWTKANLLQSARLNVVVINDPTLQVDDQFYGTVVAKLKTDEQAGVENPKTDEQAGVENPKTIGEYDSFDVAAFTLFNGNVNLSNH